MKMPPLLADFTHARPCKPFCEKYLTLPGTEAPLHAKEKNLSTSGKERGLPGKATVKGRGKRPDIKTKYRVSVHKGACRNVFGDFTKS